MTEPFVHLGNCDPEPKDCYISVSASGAQQRHLQGDYRPDSAVDDVVSRPRVVPVVPRLVWLVLTAPYRWVRHEVRLQREACRFNPALYPGLERDEDAS